MNDTLSALPAFAEPSHVSLSTSVGAGVGVADGVGVAVGVGVPLAWVSALQPASLAAQSA